MVPTCQAIADMALARGKLSRGTRWGAWAPSAGPANARATPSNAAQILVPDKNEVRRHVHGSVKSMISSISALYAEQMRMLEERRKRMLDGVLNNYERTKDRYVQLATVLSQLDPRTALQRGYALVFSSEGKPLNGNTVSPGDTVLIETNRYNITAGVQDVAEKHS